MAPEDSNKPRESARKTECEIDWYIVQAKKSKGGRLYEEQGHFRHRDGLIEVGTSVIPVRNFVYMVLLFLQTINHH